MRKIKYNILIALVFFTGNIILAQENTLGLGIGDMAPPLAGIKWLKGKEVPSFEKGHIYVIEFGYIGCPGCNISIPHMSEIADKYRNKLTLISVFYREKESRMPRFLTAMGDQITYSVVLDKEPENKMANTWLKPAGINYAPSAFLINQDGKIVWIGNPLKDHGIDEAIEEVLNTGTVKLPRLNTFLKGGFLQAAELAKEQGELKTSIAIMDRLIDKFPSYNRAYLTKIRYLYELNEIKGYEYIRKLMNSVFKKDYITLTSMADQIDFLFQQQKISNPDWNLVIQLYNRANKVDPYVVRHFGRSSNIAQAYAQQGKIDKAIEIMERTISEFRNSDLNVNEGYRMEEYLMNKLNFIKKNFDLNGAKNKS